MRILYPLTMGNPSDDDGEIVVIGHPKPNNPNPGGSGGGGGGGGTVGTGGGGTPGQGGGYTPDPNMIAKRGGTATEEDQEIVVTALRRIAGPILDRMVKSGIKVVASRGSILDYRSDLKGKRPRGWPPGSSYDDVGAAYFPDKKEVVVAIVGHDTPEGPHVPGYGEKSGSQNTLIHEITHSLSFSSKTWASSDFAQARNADIAQITAYERQAGNAGLSETYAESAARFYGGSYGNISTPNLDAYWRSHPLAGK